MRGFAPSIRRVIEVIYGPEPIGRATVAGTTFYEEMDLSGRSGYPHFNMTGDPALTYGGWVASPQQFQGQAQMGSTKDVIVQEYPALPAEQVPPALPAAYDEYFGQGGILG